MIVTGISAGLELDGQGIGVPLPGNTRDFAFSTG
jgi:hypothetical protein